MELKVRNRVMKSGVAPMARQWAGPCRATRQVAGSRRKARICSDQSRRENKMRAIAGFAAALLASGLCSGPGFGQDVFPSRPVRIVVPFPPAGPPDIMARLAAQRMTEVWSKPVIVENRAGATGTIGTQLVTKSPADGHTLLLTPAQPFVIAPALIQVGYDPRKDLAPIGIPAEDLNVVTAHPSSGVKSLAELIALAKSRPGQLNYSSSGLGSLSQLCFELIKQTARIDVTHVPYGGIAQSTGAVLSGETSFSCGPLQQALPHVKAGRLNALGITAVRGSPLLPQLQTLAAQGWPDLVISNWYGIFVPPAVPLPAVTLLRDTLRGIFSESGARVRLEALGLEMVWQEGAEVSRRIDDELARWRKVVAAARIKLE
ncbi:MAG: tripartite tricarboxylate transporter substrate binding protein [Burkholderiales bacterium]|nr:tripartite tricarboxylate transporter substrate binding protein [Burkholderiales bacterium]